MQYINYSTFKKHSGFNYRSYMITTYYKCLIIQKCNNDDDNNTTNKIV